MEIYMNILFYDMGSYTYQDTLFYLKQLGHTCKTVYYHFPNKFHDDFCCDRFEKQLQSDSYDAVMSINFFPLAAALDIMGSRGVLLSNFQPELAEYFNDGQDLILYSSMEEAVDKAAYYLKHDDARRQLALNGYEKIKEYFTYEDCIQKMLTTI